MFFIFRSHCTCYQLKYHRGFTLVWGSVGPAEPKYVQSTNKVCSSQVCPKFTPFNTVRDPIYIWSSPCHTLSCKGTVSREVMNQSSSLLLEAEDASLLSFFLQYPIHMLLSALGSCCSVLALLNACWTSLWAAFTYQPGGKLQQAQGIRWFPIVLVV